MCLELSSPFLKICKQIIIIMRHSCLPTDWNQDNLRKYLILYSWGLPIPRVFLIKIIEKIYVYSWSMRLVKRTAYNENLQSSFLKLLKCNFAISICLASTWQTAVENGFHNIFMSWLLTLRKGRPVVQEWYEGVWYHRHDIIVWITVSSLSTSTTTRWLLVQGCGIFCPSHLHYRGFKFCISQANATGCPLNHDIPQTFLSMNCLIHPKGD